LPGNGGRHSLVGNEVCDVAKCSIDSAFTLPPSRASQQPPGAEKPLPVPVVAARLRDDGDRSASKPRIWSLAEVATSGEPRRPKITDYRRRRETETETAVSVEFRPWSTTPDTARSTEARPGPWQTAFLSAGDLSATTADTRWLRNNPDSDGVSPRAAD